MADAEQKIGNLIEDKLNAKRLMERVRALTNNTEYKLIGVNKRY
jgi:hypothetical protein